MSFGDVYDPAGVLPPGLSYPIVVDTVAPPSPNKGMAWYDQTTGNLSVYDGAQWQNVSTGGGSGSGGITVSATAPPNPTTGGAWLNPNTGALQVWNGSNWVSASGLPVATAGRQLITSGAAAGFPWQVTSIDDGRY